MKGRMLFSLVAVCTMLLGITNSAGAQDPTLWKWQYGLHSMNAVHFNNTNEGWAVGDWGLIIHTEDGGLTWERQEPGVSNSLEDVQFVDANEGWVIGSAGVILHTSNGGFTWNVQGGPLAVDLQGMFFLDNQRGWIGLPDGVLRTIDGGAHWTKTGSGVPNQVLDIQFLDEANGALVSNSGSTGGGHILRTTDGGDTWLPTTCTRPGSVFPCVAHFRALHFPNNTFGVAVGGWVNPQIYLTNDGGVSWVHQETDIKFAVPESVHFIDENNGWAVGEFQGGYLRTSDGGLTWTKLDWLSAGDIQFVDASTGFVASRNSGILLSTDGGYTWSNPDCFDYNVDLYGAAFVNSNEGWVVGGNRDTEGKILHTTDGGQSWEVQQKGNQRLLAVHFVDQSGWVVGEGGKILATTNGGNTWVAQAAGTSYVLHDVDFVDDSYGWTVGEQSTGYGDGRVWRTTDGGAHWLQAGYFEGWGYHGKHGVDFVNREIGYIAGAVDGKGSVHKSIDRGQTWIEKPLGGDYPILNDLGFINANEGWVVGDGGFIARTTNGGDTWDLQASGTGAKLYAVAFLDSQRGYAVGQKPSGSTSPDANVLKTTDGGLTWVEETIGVYNYSGMRGVAFPDPYRVWVVGEDSLIMSYVDPDIPASTPIPTRATTPTPTNTPTATPTLTVTPGPTSISTPAGRIFLPLILKRWQR